MTWTKLGHSNLVESNPNMLAHSSGATVLATRKGYVMIHLSFDQGRTWTRPYRISDGSGMMNMAELAENMAELADRTIS